MDADTVTLLSRIAFLVGAVTDGLALLPMLSPRVGAALFGGRRRAKHHVEPDAEPGGGPRSSRPEVRYAMDLAASLMASWTLLLLWAAASPIERRAVLLLTVFPGITGIVLATTLAARRGVVLLARVVPLWIHLGLLSLLYLVVYRLSSPLAP